ncbi:MAG: NmrA family NAD(P)-binding protein [Gammaproteobacteria bacterium]|nr:NmrA family NAD(P)-binding protein [Gammaproteobacteria bacterium]
MQVNKPDTPILVTGATGAQGGAAARALLATGFRVRALVRNLEVVGAQELARRGVEIVKGDLNDAASILAAARGAYGVFSVQRPAGDEPDSELRHGFGLVKAAHEAGVTHFVHTSVAEADKCTTFPQWRTTSPGGRKYWTDKRDIEEAVRNAGFAKWTVLRPAFMMDNFAVPKALGMFPLLKQGRIISAMNRDTRLQLIAADDVGAFTAAALVDPARFHGQNIDMAAEALTMEEAAAVLNQVLGKSVTAQAVSSEEAVAVGRMNPGWVAMQEWINEVGYRADIAKLKSYGVPLTSFAEWVKRHATEIVVEG